MGINRFKKGLVWGVLATLGMSIIMISGKITGLAPMPAPIPVAVVKNMVGAAPKPILMILAIIAHLGYGGVFGGILAVLINSITVKKAIGLGLVLWGIMQVIVLPFIGWGIFGNAVTPKIALATLILHLIYGLILGTCMDRKNVVRD